MGGKPAEAVIAKRDLKILMTTDAVGGVWQYSVDLIAGLAETGTQVLLASLGPRPSATQKQQLQALPGVTLVESDYALEWMFDPWHDVDASGEWLLRLQSDFKADVVHLNGYSHAALGWRTPALVVAHSCVFSWWRAVRGCAPAAEWAEYKRRVAAGLNAASAVVAPSAYMARALKNEYGFSAERVPVIHNFTRAQPYNGAIKQPFCLAAGRLWDAAKNLELLDKVAPHLKWPVHVAGESSAPSHNILLLGNLPHADFVERLHRAGIFLHPALYEPFGLCVLEAARSGCCLVLSDIPSLRELWDGAAIFIDPRDPDAWVSQTNRLALDSQARNELAGRALSHSRKYCVASQLAHYSELYRSLSGSKESVGEDAAA